MGDLTGTSAQRRRGHNIVRFLTLPRYTDLGGSALFTIPKRQRGRTIRTGRPAIFISIITVLSRCFTERFSEFLISADNFKVPIYNRNKAGNSLEEEIVFPLANAGFGHVGRHLDDVLYLSILI